MEVGPGHHFLVLENPQKKIITAHSDVFVLGDRLLLMAATLYLYT